jgi:hypothetical protein
VATIWVNKGPRRDRRHGQLQRRYGLPEQGSAHKRLSAHRPHDAATFAPSVVGGYPRAPTARATTINEVSSAVVASIPINAFARLVNGMVSVGLNALELVVDK